MIKRIFLKDLGYCSTVAQDRFSLLWFLWDYFQAITLKLNETMIKYQNKVLQISSSNYLPKKKKKMLMNRWRNIQNNFQQVAWRTKFSSVSHQRGAFYNSFDIRWQNAATFGGRKCGLRLCTLSFFFWFCAREVGHTLIYTVCWHFNIWNRKEQKFLFYLSTIIYRKH